MATYIQKDEDTVTKIETKEIETVISIRELEQRHQEIIEQIEELRKEADNLVDTMQEISSDKENDLVIKDIPSKLIINKK